MKLTYVLAGLFIVLVVGSAAVVASNNDGKADEAGISTAEMMEGSCPYDMMDSGECLVLDQCRDMMEGHMMNTGCLGMDGAKEDHMSSMMDEEHCSMMDSDDTSKAKSSGMMQMMM